jgi:4-hydroxybenzoate polyprenyltransferase
VGLLYIGGMALNDVMDFANDKIENPHRPLVRGAIDLPTAWSIAFVSLILGCLLCALWGALAFALAITLAAAIILYNALHRRFPAAAVLMGLCRALIYPLACVAVDGDLSSATLWVFTGILFAHTLAVTVVSQIETKSQLGWRRGIVVVIPFLILPTLFVGHLRIGEPATIFAILTFAWMGLASRNLLAKPSTARRTVMAYLAGIFLIDLTLLAILDRPLAEGVALAAFVITTLAHRRILGS